ncbi:DeoR/GlpR family DNA-binding transcription regulator [Oceanimonas sp. NS1]|uniref:Alkaline phosphatase n=1 Tax=Oceanimonas doudoroffii TaxID=84158 RepID=A0A233RD23_9GAMM|nr:MULTISPECIES: DeoR/GlpR family DNA-binding transcription regulator [Oceanimonas]MCT7654301.1 DeoR/GlpR family DNA-binding transcription regulator [Oceanimonas sp. NS1]NHH99469.1 Glucitol operon repressor [Oceanimonas sp. MB9]OXY81283.1 alkaline phosphatase [Oceanimonas doudoroffii]
MIPAERRGYIYRYVHERNVVSINELAAELNVSHMTVRRDIQQLEAEGKVVPVSGGVRLNDAVKQELAYSEKAGIHHQRKMAIGQAAADLVEDGQVIYLDAGTTTFEVARGIATRANLTVVTNDFTIAHYLMQYPQLTLFHTGGLVDARNRSCVGQAAATLLEGLNLDLAFISSSSWDAERGLSTPSENKVMVKQALLRVARRRILVSDSSKYGKYGMFRICPLTALTDIISDTDLGEETAEPLRGQGLQVSLVSRKIPA